MTTTAARPSAESSPSRGRPRDESSRAAILAAMLDEVSAVGIAGLTVDAVAARAGVGKATLYRRWSTKEAMMLDAWMSCTSPKPTPDTGTLRGDLAELFDPAAHPMTDDTMQRVFPQMIAAAKVNPEVAGAYREYIAERRRPLRTALERGVARGELPADTDIALVQDLLVAPLMYRWLITDDSVEPSVVAQIIDVVLAGARAS